MEQEVVWECFCEKKEHYGSVKWHSAGSGRKTLKFSSQSRRGVVKRA